MSITSFIAWFGTGILFPVLLSGFASFFVSTSLILQKKGHMDLKSKNDKRLLSLFKNKYFMVGLVFLAVGHTFNVLSIRFGDQMLFSITNSFTIILNSIFSVRFLKETLVRSDIFAMGMICIATTCFLFVAKNDERELSKQELIDIYTKPWTLTAIGFMLCIDGLLLRLSLTTMREIMGFYLELIGRFKEQESQS